MTDDRNPAAHPNPANFFETLGVVMGTPIGLAYVQTAVIAAMTRVSLAHAWNEHGEELLERYEQEMERRASDRVDEMERQDEEGQG